MKTAIALSGGVDSSVAAHLLKEQGHDLVGVFMRFWHEQNPACSGCIENKCCNKESLQNIKRLCVRLDIPLKIYNFEKEFKKSVVDRFINYYDHGLTPNPCVWCNEDIKFSLLYQKAKQDLSIDHIATGHYANTEAIDDYHYIKRGQDTKKDQSYFLYRVPQNIVKNALFPVGDMKKVEVKKLASQYMSDFKFHQNKESQDLCFYPQKTYQEFVAKHAKKLNKPGIIINEKKERVGEHNGLVGYTIGQRKGIKIGGGQIYYVKKIDTKNNQLIVSSRQNILCDQIGIVNPIITPKLIDHQKYQVQIRYSQPPNPAKIIFATKKKLSIKFDKPQFAPTPGQHAVIYQNNTVIGGGEIR